MWWVKEVAFTFLSHWLVNNPPQPSIPSPLQGQSFADWTNENRFSLWTSHRGWTEHAQLLPVLSSLSGTSSCQEEKSRGTERGYECHPWEDSPTEGNIRQEEWRFPPVQQIFIASLNTKQYVRCQSSSLNSVPLDSVTLKIQMCWSWNINQSPLPHRPNWNISETSNTPCFRYW